MGHLPDLLTHQAPPEEVVISFTHGVRTSGKQKHATTLQFYIGPGRSLNSQNCIIFSYWRKYVGTLGELFDLLILAKFELGGDLSESKTTVSGQAGVGLASYEAAAEVAPFVVEVVIFVILTGIVV